MCVGGRTGRRDARSLIWVCCFHPCKLWVASIRRAMDTSSSKPVVTDTPVCRGISQRHHHKMPPALWAVENPLLIPASLQQEGTRVQAQLRGQDWSLELDPGSAWGFWHGQALLQVGNVPQSWNYSSLFLIFITSFLFYPCTKQGCYSEGFSFSFKDFLASPCCQCYIHLPPDLTQVAGQCWVLAWSRT